MIKRILIILLVLLMPISSPAQEAKDPTLPETAEELLQFAFAMQEATNLIAANWAFERTLKTGQLNNRGRALCYSQIGFNYKLMGEIDKAAEALFFFTIVAQELIEQPDLEFIEATDLVLRAEQATRFIEDLWRERNERVPRPSSRD